MEVVCVRRGHQEEEGTGEEKTATQYHNEKF